MNFDNISRAYLQLYISFLWVLVTTGLPTEAESDATDLSGLSASNNYTDNKAAELKELHEKVALLQLKVSENVIEDKLIELFKKITVQRDESNAVYINSLLSQIDFYRNTIELLAKSSLSIKTEIEQLAILKTEAYQKEIAVHLEEIKAKNMEIAKLNGQIEWYNDILGHKDNIIGLLTEAATNAANSNKTEICENASKKLETSEIILSKRTD